MSTDPGQRPDCMDRIMLMKLLAEPVQHLHVAKGAKRQVGERVQAFIRKLKRQHAYRGWRLQVDREKLGLTVTAFIVVKLKAQNSEHLKAFMADLSGHDEVVQLHMVSGAYDFFLEFVGTDMPHLNDFRRKYINGHALVQGTQTLIALPGEGWEA